MSTIEEPVGNGDHFVCCCLPFVNSTPIGFEGGDDILAVSIGPSTTAPPALTDNGRIVGEIGCYEVGSWEDAIADDVLESVAVDFDAMRAAGAV